MRASTALILLAMVLGIAVLSALGFWQLDRLSWKEGLLAKVEQNLNSEPVEVSAALNEAKAKGEIGLDYRPVKIAGNFSNVKPIYEFTTFNGKSGWNVYSLLEIRQIADEPSTQYAIINRGFIEYENRDAFENLAPSTEVVQITGLLRSSPDAQPSAAYDNDITKRTFYWRDIKAMAKVWKKEKDIEVNWYIDAGLPNAKVERSTSPRPGTTLINFPNSHLQYAFTWFGLAFALLGVGSYFLYSRRSTNGSSK